MKILKRFISLFLLIVIVSCSKKHVPAKTSTEATTFDSVKVVTVRKKAKPNFPKIITVNDAAAKKSTDGRLFYDVMGHRYWKNYKDGKYYLFNKSMYNNPDFNAR
jgi:hypothetical protein